MKIKISVSADRDKTIKVVDQWFEESSGPLVELDDRLGDFKSKFVDECTDFVTRAVNSKFSSAKEPDSVYLKSVPKKELQLAIWKLVTKQIAKSNS